jgi:hypothetical protein
LCPPPFFYAFLGWLRMHERDQYSAYVPCPLFSAGINVFAINIIEYWQNKAIGKFLKAKIL